MTRETDRQGSHHSHRWFSSKGHQQERNKRTEEGSQQGNSPKRLAFWIRLLLLMLLLDLFFYGPFFFNLLKGQPATVDLSYSRFLQQVEHGNVSSVTIKSDNSVTGVLKSPMRQQQISAAQRSGTATHFTTFIQTTGDPTLLPLLKQKGVKIGAQSAQPSGIQTALELLLNALPVLLLLYFGVMSWRGMRQMQELQVGGLFGIGRSGTTIHVPTFSSGWLSP